jgi:DNA-directed RNA polymerase specialized sigma24 family protein
VAIAPDVEIIHALPRGDTHAFDQAYARLRAPLYAFLVRLTGRAALAEDLLQETWLRLARSAAALPLETELRPWLFTVSRNPEAARQRLARGRAELREPRLARGGLLMIPSHEDILLRNLPFHDVDPVLNDRLRRGAHALMVERASALQQASGWAGYYHGMIEPTAVLALGFGYLISSFQATMALLL